ncbi:MAG: sulfotransferase [Nocardioidaceae bacterium]|nr:sulfotransferase [Nocardioidaceae bacterium]NUS52557.1 sulfotransferase [Nocardioidaceae bacterium]
MLPGSAQAPRGGRLPDFLLVGAPKAGTTALHAALAQHPELFLSRVKEPKYYLCGDSPPPAYRGPGDAHSNQEWIWQRQRYLDLFADAGEHQLAGESTPFYLYHRDARRRIATDLPGAKLVAVLRDPVDRAYSNWMHLWADGLEPCGDVVEACAREGARIDAGWAPFWHYRAMGMYGRQLADLYEHVGREQVLVIRYAALVDDPRSALNRVARFLGIAEDVVTEIPSGNSRPFVHPSVRTRVLGPVVRAGARAGQFLPPQAWRTASRPIVGQLHQRGNAARPRLTPEQREALREPFLEDISLLEGLTGESYADWRVHRDGDSFATRNAGRVSG